VPKPTRPLKESAEHGRSLRAACETRGRGGWIDHLAIPAAAVWLMALAGPRVPPGICYHDSGDLQTAAATLGIAHPPGYAGYAGIGYLSTLVPVWSPARAVSMGCFLAGLAGLIFCGLIQARLGVNAWIAGAVMLGAALHPRVWINLVIPEVYAPTAAFVFGSGYCLVHYVLARDERPRRWLVVVFFLLGFAIANRPPILLMLPGFLLACGMAWRKWKAPPRRIIVNISTAVGSLLLPCLVTASYLWVRDTADNPYNYVEGYARETAEMPAADEGAAAKVHRIHWLVTGRQYRAERVISVTEVGERLSWLARQASLSNNPFFILIVTAVAFGVVSLSRRSFAALVMVAGIVLGGAAFICRYRVYDTAADIMPILGALAILAGAGLAPLFARPSGAGRLWTARLLFLTVLAWSAIEVGSKPDYAGEFDAEGYIRAADLGSLPSGALVLSTWRLGCPLQYARLVEARRADIDVVVALPDRWMRHARRHVEQGGTVFLAEPISPPPGVSITPHGNLWRLIFQNNGGRSEDFPSRR